MRAPLTPDTLESYRLAVGPLAAAFDLVHDHVVITDENANIVYANAAATRTTGYTPEELLGKNPGDLFGGNMPKEFYDKMWRTIKVDKQPFIGEIRNIKKDGGEAWQEIHISPVLATDGSVKYFIAIEPDVSSKMREQLVTREFTSIVGHQLKAPIAGVRLVLEWLLEGGGLTSDQKESLEDAYNETSGLADLVNDLLLLTRIERTHMEVEQIDLCTEITSIVATLSKQHTDKTVVFNCEASGGYTLASNRQLTRQIFVNIITNAVEYSKKEGGLVTVTLVPEDRRFVYLPR